MAQLVLRPNAVVSNPGWTVVSAASANAALADDTDNSYLTDKYSQAQTQKKSEITLDFSTGTLPAGAYIERVTPLVRFSGQAVLQAVLKSGKAGSPFANASSINLAPPGGGATASMSGPSAGSVYGDAQNEVDNLRLYLNASAPSATGPGTMKVYEAWLYVDYNEIPVVSAVTVSGYTLTTKPTVNWAYDDPELDGQQGYQVKVFSAAQVTAGGALPGGFSPETAQATWDSGQVRAPDQFAAVGTSLAVGTSYTAYVRATDYFDSGRWSAWAAGTAFTINVDVPAAPSLTSAAVAASASVSLGLSASQNLLSSYDASIETPGADTWASNANCTVARDTAQFLNGGASLKVTSIAAGNMSARTGYNFNSVAVGQAYTGRASFRPAVTTRSCVVSLRWFNSGGGLLSQTDSAPVSCAAAAWTGVSVNGTAPAGAAYAGLLVQVNGTAAAGEAVNADQFGIMPGTGAPWTRGGLSGTQSVEVQRTYDDGATWEPVPTMSALSLSGLAATQQLAPSDYSARPNTPVRYRARSSATDGALSLTSAWSATTAAVTVAVTAFWLKNPANPAMNARLTVAGDLASNRPAAQGNFRPVGRNRAVVVHGDVYGEEFQLPLTFRTEADYDAFQALRDARTTLLLQSDMTRQWWVVVGPDAQATLVNNASRKTAPFRQVSATLTEVDVPL